jgi:uncharacterized protein YwqG
MMKRATIELDEVKQPIREAVTKFGGQPVWVEEPQWPLSRESGEPMRFICQIRLDEDLFGATAARMAYVFMTDGEDYVDGTWEPDGGENAVVLQPGGAPVETAKLAEGPTLYRMVKKLFRKDLVSEPCEYAVRLTEGEDPPLADEDVSISWSEAAAQEHEKRLAGNKLGGTPLFIQGPELPDEGEWRLLLQLDSTQVPFYLNFGDAGVGYAFISLDGRKARFLWQGC